MPDLYQAGAGLLEAAGKQSSDIANQEQAKTDTTVQAGTAAGKNIHEDIRDLNSQQAQMALEKMKASDKMQGKVTTITPQIAIGMAKNTGDPSWMQSIGQDMRTDVLLGLYTHGLTKEYAKKAPKITQVYGEDGKIRHSVVYTDEQGNEQQLLLDSGMTPEKLNKGKGGAGRGAGAGGAKDETFKKNKQFMSSHEKQAALFNDPTKSAQLKSLNPDQWEREHDEFLKDQDRYDQLKTGMGAAGGPQPAAAGAKAPEGGSAPFDPDSFIKDALGQ